MTFSFDSPQSRWSFKHSTRVLHPQCGHSNKGSTLPNGMETGLENKLCMLGYECNKLSSGEIEGRNTDTISKICRDVSLFWCSSFLWYSSFSFMKKFWKIFMILEFHEFEFHQKIFGKFEGYFFKKLKFMELKYHWKLDFSKLEYPKSSRSLHILETVLKY